MKIAEAFVEVRPDTTGFAPAVEKEAATASQRASSQFKKILTGAGIALFAKGSFDELQEAEKSAKQLEQTIRSTGGAAGVTAKHADDLANSISKASVVDDELVANTERILLTFTQIKNTNVDKTFDRATQAAIDMSAALGTDAQSSAIQLGKALNDPVKGITALARAGVSFTADQKAVIKSLAETGQTAKAQGLILSEVEKEFGGQAAASATDADKARVAFANLEESVGRALVPALNAAAQAGTVASDVFSAQPPILQTVEISALAAGVAYAKLKQPVTDALTSLRGFQAQATGLKGALGKAGIAGAAILAADAGDNFFRNWQTSRFRSITSDADKLAQSLTDLAQGASSDLDVKGLAGDFGTLDSTLAHIGANPLFRGSFFGDNAHSSLEAAKKDIDAVDKSLADLVNSGNSGQARDEFQALSTALESQGVSAGTIRKAFDDYASALDHSGSSAAGAASSGSDLASSTDDVADSAQTAAEKLQDYNDQLDTYLGKTFGVDEANDRIASGFNDLSDAVQGLKDLPGKLALPDFQGNTEPAIRYRDVMRDLVSSYGDLIAAAGTTASQRDLLIEGFREQAIAAGVPKAEVDKYASALRGLPTSVDTKVNEQGASEARTRVAELARKLGDVDGKTAHARVTVDTGEALAAIARLRQSLILSGTISVGGFSTHASGGALTEGLNLLGEEGPELAEKHGSQVTVIPAGRTRSMLSGGSGGDTHVHLHVQGFFVGTERELADRVARLLETLN